MNQKLLLSSALLVGMAGTQQAFAQKKKVTPQKQQKQPQKKQEKASDSNEQKPKTSEILAMLPQLRQCAKKPIRMVLGDVCLHH